MNNKCRPCGGHGIQVHVRPSDRYACGFVTVAETCPSCLGTGRSMPIPTDFKTASTGDSL